MRHLALVAALLLAGTAVDGQGIASYRERVELGADGRAAVEVRVATAATGNRFELPLAWSAPDSTRIEASGGARVDLQPAGKLSRALILADGAALPVTVRLAVTLAAGDGAYTYRLVNVTGARLDSVDITLVLPPGDVPQSVRWSLPPGAPQAGLPPLTLAVLDGRRTVGLRADHLASGEAIALAVHYAPMRKSRLLLVIGLLFAALSLRRTTGLRQATA